MSFATALTVNDGVGDHVFDTVKNGDYEVVRRDASAPLDQESIMRIAHDRKTDVVRSVVRFERVVEDANGVQGKLFAQLTLGVPVKIAVLLDVQKAYDSLRLFMTTAGVRDKLINLES